MLSHLWSKVWVEEMSLWQKLNRTHSSWLVKCSDLHPPLLHQLKPARVPAVNFPLAARFPSARVLLTQQVVTMCVHVCDCPSNCWPLIFGWSSCSPWAAHRHVFLLRTTRRTAPRFARASFRNIFSGRVLCTYFSFIYKFFITITFKCKRLFWAVAVALGAAIVMPNRVEWGVLTW